MLIARVADAVGDLSNDIDDNNNNNNNNNNTPNRTIESNSIGGVPIATRRQLSDTLGAHLLVRKKKLMIKMSFCDVKLKPRSHISHTLCPHIIKNQRHLDDSDVRLRAVSAALFALVATHRALAALVGVIAGVSEARGDVAVERR